MTKRFAGVALATMMCGSFGAIEEAKASTITLGPGSYVFSIVISDSVENNVAVRIGAYSDIFTGGLYPQVENVYGERSFFTADPNSPYGGYADEEPINVTYNLFWTTASNAKGYYIDLEYNDYNPSLLPPEFEGQDGSYSRNYVYGTPVDNYTFSICRVVGVCASGQYSGNVVVFDSSVDLDVSSIPIPSTAYLFGAALLGLGAFGYSMKRRSQPQTT